MVDRRTFLKGSGALALAGLGAGALGEWLTRGSPVPDRAHGATKSRVTSGLPTAEWLIEENKRPGTLRWVVSGPASPYPAPIEGYVDKVSVAHGESLTLHVSTIASRWHAEVYRMGYYQGRGARLIHVTPLLAGERQPMPGPNSATLTIECGWRPSRTLDVDEGWPPGYYLIRLLGDRRYSAYVPFLVRDDASTAAFVVQSSVTTWQAYNLWGGYSLYGGAPINGRSEYDSRSRVVSFDRPYHNPDGHGSGDFLGNEFPFVYLAERLGLDVTYWTDVDLHARPELLDAHRCLVSLGHDEYWSAPMRFGVQNAITRGLNVAFLGANACYRQIRFEDSPNGADRRVVCYKDAAEDPITPHNPTLATAISWAEGPDPRPESELVGVMYQSYNGSGPLVVADPTSFVFEGTGLRKGDTIPNVIGSEFDGFEPRLRGPKNLTILGHSPTNSVSGPSASDMTYYASPQQGGVFACGTGRWVPSMWSGARPLRNRLGFAVVPAMTPLTAITTNVLRAFAAGPAGDSHPSVANWREYYSGKEAVRLGVDV